MLTVGSIVNNMNSFFQLRKSQQAMLDASGSLSSGKRINSAKDDPAGLAIATLFSSQIRSTNQSIQNANHGISLTQVADGALSGANDVLQRMRELALQASNGTLNDSNRNNIQSEITQLSEQLGDIGKNTKFNGISVFDNNNSINIQVGFNQGITLELGGFPHNSLSGAGAASGDLESGRVDAATTGVASGSISLNGVSLGGLSASTSGQADVKAELINQSTGQTGVVATASNIIEGGSVNPLQPITQGISVTVGGNTTTLGSSASLKDFVKDFNLNVAGAEATIGTDGSLQIYNDTGKDITLADNGIGGLGSLGLSDGTYSGVLSLSSSGGQEITISTTGAGTIEDLKVFGFNQQQGASSFTGGEITGQSVTSADGIQINGIDLGPIGSSGGSINASDIRIAINDITGKTGVSATSETELVLTENVTALQNNNLTINGIDVFSSFSGSSQSAVIDQINSAGIGDLRASSNVAGELVLSSASGQNINIENGDTAFQENGAAIANSVTKRGELSLTAKNGSEINITSTAAINDQTAALNKLGISDVGGFTSSIGHNVTSIESAGDLISNIDNVLNQISQSRSQLGAVQNRFASTINNLSDTLIQSESSRSRIEDTDYAQSISEFIKARLAQQTSNIMLVKNNETERSFISQILNR